MAFADFKTAAATSPFSPPVTFIFISNVRTRFTADNSFATTSLPPTSIRSKPAPYRLPGQAICTDEDFREESR